MVDLSDIKNALLNKTLAKLLENTWNKRSGGLQPGTYFARSFIPKDFLYTIEDTYFQVQQWAFAFIFFLDCIVSNKNILFCFFVSRPVLVSHKLELGTFLIIPGVFLKPSPAFQNTEATFGKCSAKEVVQQNDVMKCDSSILVARKRYMQIYKKCHTTTSMFQRILTQIQNSDIEKYISRTAF